MDLRDLKKNNADDITTNINKLMMGSAIRSAKKVSNENAIRIEDLVKKGREMLTVDNGIERFEFHEYEPVARTNLNTTGEISINIEQQDLFTLPSEAYLLFEGQLVKADGTAYTNTDAVTLTNNGRATTMLGMLKYPSDFQVAQGLNQHNFGFCDDYDKVIYGFKHTINLKRDSDDDAIFKLAGVAQGKVNLNKISLFIPHVIPSDVERLSLKTSSERPRYIIVAFQTNKNNDQNANASIFDHCDLKNMYIMLNQERYPAVNYNLSFPNQQFLRAYRDAAVFNEKLYGTNELITNSNINPSEYKDLYPLFVFDVSRQPEKLKPLTIDVQVKATFNTAVPAGTDAYAVVLSDRMIEFQSDGNKMNVAY
ncbi:uncharacterized protein LOC136088226 [Hydra vulgaris]|uniref:Uncharacterized protein LOC136088226 n=1 Tax=Hydra vulgaris TaxID=6087 RepID=A0ABM4D186_HYDVU